MKDNDDSICRPFLQLLDILIHLRSPDGCPWDREQTPLTLREYLVEEAYEAVQAIEDDDPEHVTEELGDVLLLVAMITQMYTEHGQLNMKQVIDQLNLKLIRRHPHVFSADKAEDADQAIERWHRVKASEKGSQKMGKSVLDNIPKSYPPIQRAFDLQKNAASQGFDWLDEHGPKEKIFEEMQEIQESSNEYDREEEVGDLLFSVINYARHLKINPSIALNRSNAKFDKRFRRIERRMKENGLEMSGNNDVMNDYWNESKKSS